MSHWTKVEGRDVAPKVLEDIVVVFEEAGDSIETAGVGDF